MGRSASFAAAQGNAAEAKSRLMEAFEREPRREDLERLEELYAQSEGATGDRLRVIAELMTYGGPMAARLMQLSRGLVEMGDRRGASL